MFDNNGHYVLTGGELVMPDKDGKPHTIVRECYAGHEWLAEQDLPDETGLVLICDELNEKRMLHMSRHESERLFNFLARKMTQWATESALDELETVRKEAEKINQNG